MSGLQNIKNGGIEAAVYGGQLVSLKKAGVEFFHDGALPENIRDPLKEDAWKNSEIVMFPIVGPAFRVVLNGNSYLMDQHGISRNLLFDGAGVDTESEVKLRQVYSGDEVFNPKFRNGREHPKYIQWVPYFMYKDFSVTTEGLSVRFDVFNNSDVEMKFAFGWHPAFRLQGKVEDSYFRLSNGEELDLQTVLDTAGRTVLKNEVGSVIYSDSSAGDIMRVSSSDFNKVMIWCPSLDSGMFCIEPVTHLPDPSRKMFLGDDYEILKPTNYKYYRIDIKLY